MLARVLFILLPLVFSFNSEAVLKLNLETQKDFLNSLYDDFEKLKYKKQKSDTNKDEEDEQNNEIDQYQNDILTLKNTLITIEEATSQKNANEKVLKELVDEYNKKMEELEKNYKFILAKSKRAKPDDEYLSSRANGVQTIVSLQCNRNRKRIGDMKKEKFQPLELIEVRNDANKVEQKMPIEQEG